MTAPAQQASKSYTRRIFTTLLVSTALLYTVSVPLGFYSLRYRDFLVESIPGGEQIGDIIDSYELGAGRTPGPQGTAATGTGKGSKETELTRYAETQAKAGGWELKPAKERAEGEKRESISEVAKARAEQLARQAKLELTKVAAETKKVEEQVAAKVASETAAVKAVAENAKVIAHQVEDKVVEVADSVTSTISHVAHSVVDTAVSAEKAVDEALDEAFIIPTAVPPTPAVTRVVDPSRPRELDATPLPPKRSSNQIYAGPPLPIGHEPPTGYELARGPATPAGELKPVSPPPAPLPLIAPALKDVAVSEPMLGQLAATIDSLASFVANNTDAVSSSASNVLTTAQTDIQKLAARLEAIKVEENAKLEESLKAQAHNYSGLLMAAEKELIERLDTQEEDWKKAFDDERKNLVNAYKEKLDKELETQQEIINLRLKEEVIAQGIELQRRWVREIKIRVEQERGGRLAKLAELEGGIRKLETVTRENEELVNESVRVRKIWTAVKAVEHRIETGAAFDEELAALKRIVNSPPPSVESTPTAPLDLIALALSTVPSSVSTTGITSFPSLANRFTTSVSPQLRRAALYPENGGMFAYFSSYLLSYLLFQKQGWAEGDDVVSVIARTEYFLNQKDLVGAAKEVNTLSGWPRKLAMDWLVAARNHLEVKQAFEVRCFVLAFVPPLTVVYVQIAEAQATLASLNAL